MAELVGVLAVLPLGLSQGALFWAVVIVGGIALHRTGARRG